VKPWANKKQPNKVNGSVLGSANPVTGGKTKKTSADDAGEPRDQGKGRKNPTKRKNKVHQVPIKISIA